MKAQEARSGRARLARRLPCAPCAARSSRRPPLGDPTPSGRHGSDTPDGSIGIRRTSTVAVDESTGDMYVTDAAHDAVDRFDSNGAYNGLQIEARAATATTSVSATLSTRSQSTTAAPRRRVTSTSSRAAATPSSHSLQMGPALGVLRAPTDPGAVSASIRPVTFRSATRSGSTGFSWSPHGWQRNGPPRSPPAAGIAISARQPVPPTRQARPARRSTSTTTEATARRSMR